MARAKRKARPRKLLRAATDELGLTKPKSIERAAPPGRRPRPAKPRVRARSLRARGD